MQAASILFALHTNQLIASELNYNFLQGGANVDIKALEDLSRKYTPGQYLVDVELNGQHLGKRLINIEREDTETLCLSLAWLSDARIDIAPDFYQKVFNSERECYWVEHDTYTQVNFDFSALKLSFQMPQKALKPEVETKDWDYGNSALRINYNANMSINETDTNVYGSLGLTGNVGHWVADTSMSVTEDSVQVPMLSASRALYDLKADLSVGRTYVGNSLVGSAGLTGLGLASNSSMLPNDVGYAPIFSGIANSDARVTLTQNGNIVYSEMVPPGPFEISDVSLLGRGDVTMTITESDGSDRVQLFPLTVVPNMLSVGELEYSLYSGLRDSDNNKLRGVFAAGNLGYGFANSTLRGSALIHAKYAAIGGEWVTGLGIFGTLSLNGAYSYAKYDANSDEQGAKVELSYSKRFDDMTDLRLVSRHYSSDSFTEFSSFDPTEKDYLNYQEKNRVEMSLSRPFNSVIRGSLSAWHSDYWNDNDNSLGVNAYFSAQFERVSTSFGANYSLRGSQEDYGLSLSVSVPFDIFSRSSSAYATMTTNKQGHTSYNTGVSSSINDQLDYSASVAWSEDSDNTYTLRSNYYGDRVRASGQLSQSGSYTTGSASMSGTMIALPEDGDVLFTRNLTDTIAIAKVDGVKDVEFSSSPYPTNNKGNAVVPISAYRENTVTVVGNTLPTDIELLDTSVKTVPSGRAVVQIPFGAVEVNRYLFQITDSEGKFIKTGSWATSNTDVPLGFVVQNGVLFVNTVDELSGFYLDDCVIGESQIKQTTKLQEVACEN